MKKQTFKRNPSDFDDSYNSGKGSVHKDKSSKKRLSIYDEYEDDEDDFMSQEKFKHRRK